jgi:hypothetical protein
MQLTAYIAIAMAYERRDLERRFGSDYRRWKSEAHAASPRPGVVASHARFAVAAELRRRHAQITQEPLPAGIVEALAKL